MDITKTPTTADLIEAHGRLLRQAPFTARARICTCCAQHPLYDCGGVLLCAHCDTDELDRK